MLGPEDRPRFARALAFLCVALDCAALTAERLDVIWASLRKHVTIAELERAIERAAGECEKWPPPGRLRRYVDEERRHIASAVRELEAARPWRQMEYWAARYEHPEQLPAAEARWRDFVAELEQLRGQGLPSAGEVAP